MRKILLIAVLLMNFVAVQATAQCEETYLLCKKHFTKEENKAGWNVNKQSQGLSVEKGTEYETIVTAYKGLEYRLSVCTDIEGGIPANFKLERESMVTVTDSTGNTTIERQREVVFDSSINLEELYVLFRSNKTENFYLTVTIPSTGKSKKLKDSDNVCIGVLLEHRKTKKSSL